MLFPDSPETLQALHSKYPSPATKFRLPDPHTDTRPPPNKNVDEILSVEDEDLVCGTTGSRTEPC